MNGQFGLGDFNRTFKVWFVIDLAHRLGLCDQPTVGSKMNALIDDFIRREDVKRGEAVDQ